MKGYDYSDYESELVDQDYIRMLQRPRVQYFKGCRKVLDLACGSGIFLELLQDAGIEAVGIDRNEELVKKANRRHLRIAHSDVFDYLETLEERVDGIFCSHLLEHLPFEGVVRLVELSAKALRPGGVLVLVLPNPGSIRLHLFGFWRDPEHVRFYTGGLIASVCRHWGIEIVRSNEEEMPNLLPSPVLEPIPLPPPEPGGKGFFRKRQAPELLGALREWNRSVERFNESVKRFSETLNKIWARDDEVVLVGEKQGPRG